MKITDKTLMEVLKIVFSSKRVMPARFSEDDNKSQTLFIDHGIDSDDEYEIAAQTYYVMFEFLNKVPEKEINKEMHGNIIKIGEDIALGGYLLQKKDEYSSFRDLQQEITNKNVSLINNPLFEKIINIPHMQNYFDFCMWFGRARAVGFRWGNQVAKNTRDNIF